MHYAIFSTSAQCFSDRRNLVDKRDFVCDDNHTLYGYLVPYLLKFKMQQYHCSITLRMFGRFTHTVNMVHHQYAEYLRKLTWSVILCDMFVFRFHFKGNFLSKLHVTKNCNNRSNKRNYNMKLKFSNSKQMFHWSMTHDKQVISLLES